MRYVSSGGGASQWAPYVVATLLGVGGGAGGYFGATGTLEWRIVALEKRLDENTIAHRTYERTDGQLETKITALDTQVRNWRERDDERWDVVKERLRRIDEALDRRGIRRPPER